MTDDPTNDRHSAYYRAMRDADETLAEALDAIRAESDAHRITPAEAATERVSVLERHLAEIRRLRIELLGPPADAV